MMQLAVGSDCKQVTTTYKVSIQTTGSRMPTLVTTSAHSVNEEAAGILRMFTENNASDEIFCKNRSLWCRDECSCNDAVTSVVLLAN